MYKLTDVLDVDSMETKREAWNIIGKEYNVEQLRVGKQAILENLTDSHMYHRVMKTSIIDSIKESFKELHVIAKDSVYVLKKL